MPLGEFDLIAKYLAPLSAGFPGAFGLKDDAAAFTVPKGQDLVVTTDAMVAGIHFLESDGPERIARKLLRVNISDLAAKGAAPFAYQLVLGMAGAPDEAWLAAFTKGLAEDQETYGLSLSGGDTLRTPGGTTLSLTAFGLVASGRMIRRDRALAGDALYVTGTIGDAWLGLQAKLGKLALPPDAAAHCDTRLHLPEPRLAFGLGLRGLARAAMDVSDGLIQDAGHMAAAAGLGLEIEAARVPLSAAARDHDLVSLLTGGDDYEVLFAATEALDSAFQDLGRRTNTQVTRIGRFTAGSGVRLLAPDGQAIPVGTGGYQHF